MKTTNSLYMMILAMLVLVLSAGCNQASDYTGTQTGSSTSSGGGTPATSGGWTGDAKDFAYTTFDGDSGRASKFAGKPLVVNFWAAW